MTALHGQEECIARVVEALCSSPDWVPLRRPPAHDAAMPSLNTLAEVMDLLRAVLFPGYFGPSELRPETVRYHTGAALDRVARLLVEQVRRGFCFTCDADTPSTLQECAQRSAEIVGDLMDALPRIRRLLTADAEAAFQGDPAARTPGEAIFCYPSLRALTHHRLAHVLHLHGVPLIPRIISEMAHSHTGIDIHPGAELGERLFMDHGTGIVIGETCVIGRNVRIYQGVTLGAKSFPLDAQGHPVKGIPRHPVVEDDVTIYAGATILGRVTIGRGSVIGGNVWLTRDVPPGATIMQSRPRETGFLDGAGI